MKALNASTLFHSLKKAAEYTISRPRSNRKSDFLCGALEIKQLCDTQHYVLLAVCVSGIKKIRASLWSALLKEETMPHEANTQPRATLLMAEPPGLPRGERGRHETCVSQQER